MTTELFKQIDLNLDNQIIGIREWAQVFLTDEEFKQFSEAEDRNNTLMNQYESNGLFTRELVKENVYVASLGQHVTVTVGVKTILAPGITVLDIPIDPEYGHWYARYASSPYINHSATVQI